MNIKHKNNYKKIIAALFGTVVENYDCSLYGFSAAIIASKFFPANDMITNLANAFAIYAMAYIAKPLGAVLFGTLGDKLGRKVTLNITITGIVFPTFIIGVLPEYSSLGIWSIIILIFCRILQGVFTAGEYDGAAIYIIEHLGKKNHFTASALTRTTAALGLLLGIASTNFFNSHIFGYFGWRIPFLLSLPLGLVTLYYRRYLIETPSFVINIKKNNSIYFTKLIKEQWKPLLLAILISGGFGVTYQISIIFMKQYLPIVLPASYVIMTSMSILFVVVLTISMPISGFLSDRFGVMYVINVSIILVIISAIALYIAISNNMLNLGIFACMMIAIFVAPFNGLAHGIIINGFSINTRYRSISIGHTVGSMLMSSSANYICLYVIKNYQWNTFPIIYLCIFSLLYYISVYIYNSKFIKTDI